MKSLSIRAQPFNKALCWACAKPLEKTPGSQALAQLAPPLTAGPGLLPAKPTSSTPDVGIPLSPVSFLSLESPEENLMVAFT